MLVKSQVKYIQSLGQKKHRDQNAVFIAEGPKLIAELLESIPTSFVDIYALPEWIASHEHLTKQTDITPVDEDELAKISQLQTPNQVLAVLKKWDEQSAMIAKDRLTLALDTIQDPGNLGTIIRIADWFGVSQIVCSQDCADRYNPKVVQSTMGSIARVNVFYTDLEQWLNQQDSVPIYAAVLNGQSLNELSPVQEGIIVIGNESKGISDAILKLVNHKITIPKKGKAESLNAAVATGIIVAKIFGD